MMTRRDLRLRALAQQEIQASLTLMESIMESIPARVFVKDLEGRYLFVNRQFLKISGRSREEIRGRTDFDLSQKELAPAADEHWRTVLQTGQPVEFEEMVLYPDGLRPHLALKFPVCDAAGKICALAGISKDITEHKQLEDQFLRAQRLESLGELVSGIAHDLNNTLVPVIIGVEILEGETLSKDAADMVHTMGDSARRSAEMIRQMLIFARGGEAVKSLVRPDQHLKEMCQMIADTFHESIDCHVRIGENLHPIFCIPTQIHQVLMNLCVNARDAMPAGGTLTLAVENVSLNAQQAAQHAGARPREYVCISVADTGCGIPPDQLEKIFQPFFTTKPPGKGTGLGLSTCQSIVNNHEGFITVQSGINSGTEFKVYVPAADATPVDLPAAQMNCVAH